MRLIIVADIFGRTMELDNLASLLSSDTIRTCLVDPYEGAYTPFENEQAAYDYFQDKVGLAAYE